jgi:hypothetical protein
MLSRFEHLETGNKPPTHSIKDELYVANNSFESSVAQLPHLIDLIDTPESHKVESRFKIAISLQIRRHDQLHCHTLTHRVMGNCS